MSSVFLVAYGEGLLPIRLDERPIRVACYGLLCKKQQNVLGEPIKFTLDRCSNSLRDGPEDSYPQPSSGKAKRTVSPDFAQFNAQLAGTVDA